MGSKSLPLLFLSSSPAFPAPAVYMNPLLSFFVSALLTSTLPTKPSSPAPPLSLSHQNSNFPDSQTLKMAAFSYQHQPFLLDSVFPPTKASAFMDELCPYTHNFPQFYSPESTLLDHSSKLALSDENEPSSVTRKQTTDSTSTGADKIESGEQVTQNVTRMDKKRKCRNGSSLNSDSIKGKKQRKTSGNSVTDEDQKEPKTEKKKEQKKGAAEEPPTGYIHVRARRGQATDSHSLAERVRREKISERMKILQKLVPGCEKVTGKALMLDEIINYVQSLQNQVEFLSMKLSSLNHFLYDFGMDMDAAFMVRPDQRMASMVSPLQQCSPTQTTTVFAETTTGFTPHNYPLLDATILSHLLQSQDSGNVTWDVLDDQRQKLFSSSVFNDSLCSSFH